MIIERHDGNIAMANGLYPQPNFYRSEGKRLLELGLNRLLRLGVVAQGEIKHGEPSQLIIQTARRTRADLVVVGHRTKTFLERWWSSPSGAYIVDGVPCSVLIARNLITDEDFDRYLGGVDKVD